MRVDVDDLVCGGDGFDRDIAIAAVSENHKATVDAAQEKIESNIAVGHGNDGIDDIGITAAGEIAELLVYDFDCLAVVEFSREFLHAFRDEITDAAELFVAVGVGGIAFENHLAAFEHGSFGNENDRVAAGILAAVGDEKLGQALNIEFVFRDDATIRGSRQGREHGSVTSVTAENFDDHETLVRGGGGAKTIDELECACDAGAESDAIVGAGDIIVHGFRDSDYLETFAMQAETVAKSVIASDGDERVNSEPGQIFEDFGSEVVLVGSEFVLKVRGDAGLADAAGICAGRMQESAAGAAGAIDDFFVDDEKIVGVVLVLFADHVDEAGPAVTDADDLIAFPNGAKSDATNRGIKAGNVTTASEYADDAFLRVYACHESVSCSFVVLLVYARAVTSAPTEANSKVVRFGATRASCLASMAPRKTRNCYRRRRCW